MQLQRLQQLGICLSIFAALSILMVNRLGRNGDWLLSVPLNAGPWEAVDTPLAQEFLQSLAMPKSHGVEYHNPLDEHIGIQLIAPRSFEAYREPDAFAQFQISAQRSLPLFGADKPVRAWVLKVPNQDFRVLCYAWLQSPSGKTYLFGERGLQQGFFDRFSIGAATIVRSEPLCLVRMFCRIAPTDKNGIQARRSLELVARHLYDENVKGSK